MAGGTGGHIFPGLAVAQALESKGWSLQWLGSLGGMEQELVAKYNIPLNLIAIKGLRGNGIVGWLKSPFSLAQAIWQAIVIIRRVSPDVILGFGGFASGPGGFAAFLTRKKLIIHEQNAVPGLTNKLLSKIAYKVYQAFPKTFDEKVGALTIGNPIRSEISNIKMKDKSINSPVVNVLVIGGSRGAQALNRSLPLILSPAIKAGEIEVKHQCGEAGYEETVSYYEKYLTSTVQKIDVIQFIDDMATAYRWADLVICRAGALTVSEIAAVGLAAVFVPFPHAVDDHQTLNAQWLVDNNGAVIIQQSELVDETGIEKIRQIIKDRKHISSMGDNSKQVAYLDATEQMSDACINTLEQVA